MKDAIKHQIMGETNMKKRNQFIDECSYKHYLCNCLRYVVKEELTIGQLIIEIMGALNSHELEKLLLEIEDSYELEEKFNAEEE